MKIAYINRLDFNNPGDLWSTPYHYIGKPGVLMDIWNPIDISEFECVIVGGGGLLQNTKMTDNLNIILESFRGVKIFWGGGITNNEKVDGIIKKFDIIGCRDFNCGYNYTPCASVMHKTLTNLIKTNQNNKDFLIIDHWKREPIHFNRLHTRLVNRFVSIDTILTAISDHNFLITSSYHAAYWGILLKKRVIIVSKPMMLKFTFKYQITINDEWNDHLLEETKIYDDAFDECYDINRSFYDEVKLVIN